MAIKKQEFYEGAAIHRLVCSGGLKSVSFDSPFFLFNGRTLAYLKYCTKSSGPWGFTFGPDECRALLDAKVVIGLVCGSDGIATVGFDDIVKLGLSTTSPVRIACQRKHGEYYKVWGPAGDLPKKISPSDWARLLIGESRKT